MTPAPSPATRHALVGVALLAATLLLGTTGWLYAGVAARSRDLAIAQGQVFALALVSEGRGPPRESDLQALLDANADDGLAWVGLVAPDGEVRAEVGTRLPGGPMPDADALLVEAGDRVRFFVTPPPHPRGRGGRGGGGGPPGGGEGPPGDDADANGDGGPPPGGDGPPGRDGEGPPGRDGERPAVVLEYVPLGATDLRTRSARALGGAGIGAVLLVVAAALFARQQRRAEAAERDAARHRHLASLGEMSAVLAHELRNPLAALKGHAQLLAELLPPGERAAARAERVVTEAVRLERLTDDLLAFARTGALERAEVDPCEPLRAAVAELGAERIVVEAAGAPARWSLDAARMRQVLGNLLQNALQAAPEGAVTASVRREADTLVYEVRDHGPGVPPGEEHAIFEPFRTHRTRGTGLGLAVARRIVELHRGTVTAANHPDGGAVFRVTIPEVS